MVALSIHTYANVGPNIWLRSAYIQRTSIVTPDTRHWTPDTGHRHFNFLIHLTIMPEYIVIPIPTPLLIVFKKMDSIPSSRFPLS
jgi:hypothetical protein